MYTTLVIWVAFVPIYFGSNSKVITLCLCISFSAIVALILLFFPKIYIMLFRPEKNNRSFFTTAKDVRCHIGFVPRSASKSSHSTYEFTSKNDKNVRSSVDCEPTTMSDSRHSSHSTYEFSGGKSERGSKVMKCFASSKSSSNNTKKSSTSKASGTSAVAAAATQSPKHIRSFKSSTPRSCRNVRCQCDFGFEPTALYDSRHSSQSSMRNEIFDFRKEALF